MVDEVERITVQETAEALEISSGCVSLILNDKLRCSHVSAWWIPQENKRGWVAYSKSLLQIYDSCDPRCLHELVTEDEIWEHNYEP